MLFRESETIELKEVVVGDIKKEIIAFANCDGGKLYIRVQDDGTVVGESIFTREPIPSYLWAFPVPWYQPHIAKFRNAGYAVLLQNICTHLSEIPLTNNISWNE